MKKQSAGFILLALLAWTAATCTQSSTPEPAPVGISSAQLDQAEQKWNGQNIASYRVEVLVVNSIWHAQTHQLVVENNAVVESIATCSPAPFEGNTCEVRDFTAETYTISGLFAQARSQIQSKEAQWLKISFDPTYGFPTQISFDDPNVADEDWTWRVTKFKAGE